MSRNKIYENSPEWPGLQRGVEMGGPTGIYGNSSVRLGAGLCLPNDPARCGSVRVAGVAFEGYSIMVDIVKV
jgi:hypothetical protein